MDGFLLNGRAWRRLRRFLGDIPHTEKGGIAVGYRAEGCAHVLAYVWPRQLAESPTYCDFDPADTVPLRMTLHEVGEELEFPYPLGMVAWVHTHPHLTPFLSGTDQNTFSRMLKLDPRMLAIVFDVFNHNGAEYLAFQEAGKPLPEMPDRAPTGDMASRVDALLGELSVRYPQSMAEIGKTFEAFIAPNTEIIHQVGGRIDSANDTRGGTDSKSTIAIHPRLRPAVESAFESAGNDEAVYLLPLLECASGAVTHAGMMVARPTEQCGAVSSELHARLQGELSAMSMRERLPAGVRASSSGTVVLLKSADARRELGTSDVTVIHSNIGDLFADSTTVGPITEVSPATLDELESLLRSVDDSAGRSWSVY